MTSLLLQILAMLIGLGVVLLVAVTFLRQKAPVQSAEDRDRSEPPLLDLPLDVNAPVDC
jgi:hypothetical protein